MSNISSSWSTSINIFYSLEYLYLSSSLLYSSSSYYFNNIEYRLRNIFSMMKLISSEGLLFVSAILKVLHKPRQVVGQRNIYLKSRLTRTLTLVSIIFLILYFPHALVENLSIKLVPKYKYQCDIHSLMIIRILRRLCELLNIIALSINFFLYILGVSHYRSLAIQMLGLDHFQIFLPYVTTTTTTDLRYSRQSAVLFTNSNEKRNSSTIKLLNHIPSHQNNEHNSNWHRERKNTTRLW